VVGREISKKVDQKFRVDCMPYSDTGSNSDGYFPYMDSWRSMLMQFLPWLADFVARVQAAVTTVETNMLKRVGEIAVRLKRTEGRFGILL
jgi:hypothetical protein